MSYRAVVMGGGIAIGIAAGIVLAPSSLVLWLGAIVSLFIAELIYGCFFLFLELASFWTVDIRGLRWLFGLILQLLTGALVPIWFFPDWLATLLAWSPFAAAASTPLSIYIGHTPADGGLAAVALQVGWLIPLVGLGELVWRRARDGVVVQGG